MEPAQKQGCCSSVTDRRNVLDIYFPNALNSARCRQIETVIVLLPDKDIERYIPRYGDRVAVYAFAKFEPKPSTNRGIHVNGRKEAIIGGAPATK